MGHTWRHSAAQRHHMEPLWRALEGVEQDLQDMQAVHHYLRDRETRNRLRAPPASRCRASALLKPQIHGRSGDIARTTLYSRKSVALIDEGTACRRGVPRISNVSNIEQSINMFP